MRKDNSYLSDIHRQLDSSWDFIKNLTYDPKTHLLWCVSGSCRQPEQMEEIIFHRQSTGNLRPHAWIFLNEPHTSEAFSPCDCSCPVLREEGGFWLGRTSSQVINRSCCDISRPETSHLPGGWNKSGREAPAHNSTTVQCLQITPQNLLGNNTGSQRRFISSLIPLGMPRRALFTRHFYKPQKEGGCCFPSRSFSESNCGGKEWFWRLPSHPQIFLTSFFPFMAASCPQLCSLIAVVCVNCQADSLSQSTEALPFSC